MSLLTVAQDVARVVGVMEPPSIFSGYAAQRTQRELLACANEMAQAIAYDLREWTQMKRQATLTGTMTLVDIAVPPDPPNYQWQGGTTAFNLPADYLRMLVNGNVWRSTSTQQPMTFIGDTDEWYRRRAANEYDAWGEWTLLGDQILIYPPMHAAITDPPPPGYSVTPAETATFPYLDRNCVLSGASPGVLQDAFTNDADTFRLPERALKLGMIYKWKSQKGSPYAEDLGNFQDCLNMLMGANKPAPIMIGTTPISMYARTASSWPPGWGPA
jgi:hypothetical protein